MARRASPWRVWFQLAAAAVLSTTLAVGITFIGVTQTVGTPADRTLSLLLEGGVGRDVERVQASSSPVAAAKDVAASLGVRATWSDVEDGAPWDDGPWLQLREGATYVAAPVLVDGAPQQLTLGPFPGVMTPRPVDAVRILLPGLLVSGLLTGLVAFPAMRRMNRVLAAIDQLARREVPPLIAPGAGPAGEVERQLNDLIKAHVRHASELRRSLRELEEERRVAVAAREDALQARATGQRFLAEMSHELRTPLNAIIGYSELLREEGHYDVEEELDRIEQAGRHLLGLVDELLDLAKVEQGMMEFHVQQVAVGPLCDSVIDLASALPRDPEVALEGPSVDLSLWLDPHRVRQILLNLLSNALRHTQQGIVRLDVAVEADRATFTVQDTGVGMTPEDVAVVFEPFRQAADARPGDGTGLGLPVSRALARGMGGDLVARSERGVGSAFTLCLPLATP